MKPTWAPHDKHGRLTAQSDVPDSVYAFPEQRKEPMTDAKHVHSSGAWISISGEPTPATAQSPILRTAVVGRS
jgi:hypothetical protein